VDIQDVLDDLGSTDSEVAATVTLTHAREAWRLAENGPSANLADRWRALAEHGHPQGFLAPYWMESALWKRPVCQPSCAVQRGRRMPSTMGVGRAGRTYAAALGDAVLAGHTEPIVPTTPGSGPTHPCSTPGCASRKPTPFTILVGTASTSGDVIAGDVFAGAR
jgi:hypothetical protein